MRNQGIGSWPARRARRTPCDIAVVQGDAHWTYARLHERSTRLAHGLRGLGVAKGDRVAFLGPNHPAFLETLFATGLLGAVLVPLNTRLAVAELDHCLADSGSEVLISASAELAARNTIALGDDYERLLAGQSSEPIDEAVVPDDPCLIMYTSGTTGRAKGAVLSHGNITWNSVNVLVDLDLRADEVTLVEAPLFHTAALNMTCLPTLLKGGTVVLAAAFDPDEALRLVERHRVTCLFGVPAMYDALALSRRWGDADLSSVRTLMCGGAPTQAHTIRTYLERGLVLSEGYGMTETSPGVLYQGVPHFFTDVRVVDPEGREATPGEIVVSGPNVMRGYWGLGEVGDWFHSGDVGVVAEDGTLSIVDRLKDMLISGGENVYPAEVESALAEHPAVTDCAVIGVPDEKWGEVGHAVVVLNPDAKADEQELRDFLATRLAKYKVPKTVAFAEALPRNALGKILKSRLRTGGTR
jgi:fatty-acyl-CoA synthase